MGKKEKIDPDSVINDFFKYLDQYRNASRCLSSVETTGYWRGYVSLR